MHDETTQEITLDSIRETIKSIVMQYEHPDRINRIGVFGSVARGENDEESDIDFIIDFTHDEFNADTPLSAIQKWWALEDLLYETFAPIELTLLNADILESNHGTLMTNEIKKDLVWIYDKIA